MISVFYKYKTLIVKIESIKHSHTTLVMAEHNSYTREDAMFLTTQPEIQSFQYISVSASVQ